MSDEKKQTVYEQIGDEGFRRLTGAFYKRVATDPILSEMYPKDELEESERRLRLFLLHMFGGPETYLEERGMPRLRWRHKRFTINQKARDVWFQHMSDAIDEAEIPEPAYSQMKKYFGASATAMINVVIPD